MIPVVDFVFVGVREPTHQKTVRKNDKEAEPKEENNGRTKTERGRRLLH